ncbi:MAG: alpha/beta hydrolase [Chitinophagaceae bacterium]|nr:alpha/beta hydrolase [Rubrivivax sp.]
MTPPYTAQRPAHSSHVPVRGLRYHVNAWGDAALVTSDRPALLLMHGWMDVGASFQFVVDALAAAEGPVRYVVAPDWRGYGLTEGPPTDSYWLPDYLGDLDALITALGLVGPIDLLGHSMGGNVVMTYAGLRPARIRRLVNLEGFGMPQTQAWHAPKRLVQWLDQLQEPVTLRTYPSAEAVADRLMKNNPRLTPDKAAWLAPRWSRRRADGEWHILGDPAHKRVNPLLSRREEAIEVWKLIRAPLLWVEGDETDTTKWWGDRYPRSDFDERLAVVPEVRRAVLSPCGHMLHHDQPQALAEHLLAFLR